MYPNTRKCSLFVAVFVLAVMVGCAPTEKADTDGGVEVRQPTLVERAEPAPVPRRALESSYEMVGTLQDQASAIRYRPAGDPAAHLRWPDRPVNRDIYAHFDDNPIRRASEYPVSTFSIDVDTGSYANVRRMLRAGHLPPRDAVRVEEMINYFGYDYPVPEVDGDPFSVSIDQAVTPWNAKTRLVQIGIKGYQPPVEDIPPANLVFLIDVSGSMSSADRLPLVVNGLKMLVRELGPEDRVAIVVYAGATGVVLESTPGDRQAAITAALDSLSPAGSTNGGAGIQLAYAQARQGFIEGGINRVILATDGDFNVGTVNFQALEDLVKAQRETGIALTTLGVGGGNYNEHLMEQLAAAGNGNHAYLDTLAEARKVLVDERHATLMRIAGDVKVQVEFNPAVVAEYRLIGYENRELKREDFNNDQVDAGELGPGHTVTALYEVALVGSGGERIDPLRYADRKSFAPDIQTDELGFLQMRYKRPGETESRLIQKPIPRSLTGQDSDRLAFAAAVVAFGQHLRGGDHLEGFGLDEIHGLASRAKGDDPFGYRGEFLQLVRLADSLGVAQTSFP